MNFFKLYIGDYQRDTAHLSVTEHGAYLLMLQHYYATEKPLPIGKALHRMLRAQDKAERDAIDTVAKQFWRETDQGLVNDRADAEIAKASAQADTNARIAREREAKRKATRKDHEQSTNRATNDQPNQTPDTRHHTTPIHTESISTSVAPEPTEGARVCLALKSHGIRGNPSHPLLLALINAGATPKEFADAAPAAQGKADPFAYLLGIVQGRRRDAAEAAKGIHRGPLIATTAERPLTPAERRAYESSPHLCDERVHRLMAAERQAKAPTNPANIIDMEPSHEHSRLLG